MARLQLRRHLSVEERSRRRFNRRQWARRWLAWRYLLVAAVVIGLVGGAVHTVYFSDRLAVEGGQVTGVRDLSVAEVLAAADVPTGGPLATVDLTAIERRVASLAGVREVEVSRRWPHDVLIQVVERDPLAVIERSGVFRAVDSEGIVFRSYRRAPRDLPRIETDDDTDVEALKEAVAVVAALPSEVSLIVDHLELVSIDEINLALRDGRTVRWGSAEESEAKGEVLLALLQRRAQVYDVSVPGQPTTTG
ncbi:MAG: FtsQ-type POTRA domain-containing protein [Nocardioides sp.]